MYTKIKNIYPKKLTKSEHFQDKKVEPKPVVKNREDFISDCSVFSHRINNNEKKNSKTQANKSNVSIGNKNDNYDELLNMILAGDDKENINMENSSKSSNKSQVLMLVERLKEKISMRVKII